MKNIYYVVEGEVTEVDNIDLYYEIEQLEDSGVIVCLVAAVDKAEALHLAKLYDANKIEAENYPTEWFDEQTGTRIIISVCFDPKTDLYKHIPSWRQE